MSAACVHAGIAVSNLENADRFYGQLLGLTRGDVRQLAAEQCEVLFGVPAAMQMTHYTGPDADFEIFAYAEFEPAAPQAGHACISVDDRPAFVMSCREAGLTVVEFPKGERVLVFVRDFDGNLFEVNEASS